MKKCPFSVIFPVAKRSHTSRIIDRCDLVVKFAISTFFFYYDKNYYAGVVHNFHCST